MKLVNLFSQVDMKISFTVMAAAMLLTLLSPSATLGDMLDDHRKLKEMYPNPQGDQVELMEMADDMADGVRNQDEEFMHALRTKVSPKCREQIEAYTAAMKSGKKAKEPSMSCKGELGAAMEGTESYKKLQKQIHK